MAVIIWLAIMVIFLVFEAVTVGLTTIWFAAGAFVAMIASALHAAVWVQILLFFVVSLVLLIVTRPLAIRYVNPHSVRTNYEDSVDKIVKVTKCVDNINGTGTVVLNGQEWTARMQQEEITLKEGELARVVAVEGVKLILVPVSQEHKMT